MEDEKRTRNRSCPGSIASCKGVEARDLGVVDLGELGIGLVLDPAVGQHAGAMDQAPDRSELLGEAVEKILHGLPVPDVDGVIADLGARGPDPLEVAPDLPLRLDLAQPFIESLGRTRAFGMVPDRPPDRGLVARERPASRVPARVPASGPAAPAWARTRRRAPPRPRP